MMGLVEDLMAWGLPFAEGGVGEVMAAGDILRGGVFGSRTIVYTAMVRWSVGSTAGYLRLL
jgi:hypothetical protein